MDYLLTFPERPANVALPELDRLTRESFVATHALSPGDRTMTSMPSYVVGRELARVAAGGHSDLTIELRDEPGERSFKDTPNLFSRMKDIGARVGVLGVYHPYCRIFAPHIDRCSYYNIYQAPVGHRLLPEMARVVQQLPVTRERYYALMNNRAMLPEAKTLVSDPDLDFVMIHWYLPHPPWIFNRVTHTLDLLPNLTPDGYFHNLALVDRTVGELRAAMERSGTWDSSTVLIGSDHHYRWSASFPSYSDEAARERRVPFILKIAEQRSPHAYHRTFNAIVVQSIALAFMRGQILSATHVREWLDENGPLFDLDKPLLQ